MVPHEKQRVAVAGIAYSLVVLLGNGFLPVINNARPSDLEELLFTLMTVAVELAAITPFVFIEQRHDGKPMREFLGSKASWQRYWGWFVAIGAIFAVATFLLVVGLSMSDPTTGAVAMKTMPITAVIIGYYFLGERLTWRHVACIAAMLATVVFVATKGTFMLGELSVGAVLLLVPPALWSVGHAMSKKLLTSGAVSATQMIAIRTSTSGAMLLVVYVVATGGSSAWQVTDGPHLVFMVLMGTNYAAMHYCWYKALQRIDMTIATGIGIPSPIVTALLATALLGSPIEWYHVVAMAASFAGLFGLLWQGRQEGAAGDGGKRGRRGVQGTNRAQVRA
ncbi:MAG: DMT family transporter [Candidatus Lokiarchaeota archaeon]|nr:DMT family transporter [Candidatus Lokiarchaeota archaeon]